MTQGITLVLRSILKGRFYSLVSVAGLAIAIAAVVLVSALVQHENAYEKNYSASDRIYRLNWINGGTGDRFATMFNPFSPPLAAETPEIAYATRVATVEMLLERDTETAGQGLTGFELLAFADPDYFRIFDLEFSAGSPETALTKPNSLVLTKAAAEKYFPGESAMGRILTLESNITLTVTAIIDDMPASTHFPFHFIAPLDTYREVFDGAGWLDNWGSDAVYHYLLLNPGVDPAIVQGRIEDFAERNMPFEDWDFQITMQALEDIHFTPDLQNEMQLRDTVRNILKAPRNKSDLILFSAGALILVLVASFNFMNLQIARSVGYGKQMGLLKVVGANRYRIFKRMLAESVLFVVLSMAVSLLFVELGMTVFGNMLAVNLGWADIIQPQVVAVVVTTTIGLGLISGVYPAYLMAAQKPSLILKGEFSHGQRARKIRHALVLLQFAISIILIVISLGIFAQVQFSISAPLGFEPTSTVVVPINRREVRGDYQTLRNRILEHPDVAYVTRSSIIPTGNLSDGAEMFRDGGNPEDAVAMRRVSADFNYFETFGIEMVAGRSFSRDFSADESTFPSAEQPITRSGIVINEAAARRAGWTNPSDAVGKNMRSEFNMGSFEATMIMTVVGVSNDVHFRSLRSEIVPMVFFLEQGGGRMAIKIRNDNTDDVTTHIEQVWQDVVPEIPLRMEWLDDSVAQLYDQESRILRLMASISVIAVAVACLGLFAVASLVTGLRAREVGLRKVFGATVMEIVNLLSWQFLKPVLLANLVAWPIAWFYMYDWLKTFAYRVDLNPLHFLIPGIVALVIAWVTVASQAWSVARNNPIHALRYE